MQQDAHDFRLLLNLLSESQGLPEALRILALFEHQFGMLWEPQNIRLMQKIQYDTSNGKSVLEVKPKENGNEKLLSKKVSIDESNKEKKEDEEDDKPPKQRQLQTLVVTWDDAEIADYFYE